MTAFRWAKPNGHWEWIESCPRRFASYGYDDLLSAGPCPPPDDGDSWGPWAYHAGQAALVHRDGYWIDLDRCATAAQVLDWLAQMVDKPWGTPEALGWLVRALDGVLHLQATRCGGAVS